APPACRTRSATTTWARAASASPPCWPGRAAPARTAAGPGGAAAPRFLGDVEGVLGVLVLADGAGLGAGLAGHRDLQREVAGPAVGPVVPGQPEPVDPDRVAAGGGRAHRPEDVLDAAVVLAVDVGVDVELAAGRGRSD